MNNFDILKDTIKDKVSETPTLKDLAIKINKLNEVLNNLIELIRTRNF